VYAAPSWVGLRADLKVYRREKFLPLLKSNPGSSSPYLSYYTDYIVPLPKITVIIIIIIIIIISQLTGHRKRSYRRVAVGSN
jgi:hypothetical protein